MLLYFEVCCDVLKYTVVCRRLQGGQVGAICSRQPPLFAHPECSILPELCSGHLDFAIPESENLKLEWKHPPNFRNSSKIMLHSDDDIKVSLFPSLLAVSILQSPTYEASHHNPKVSTISIERSWAWKMPHNRCKAYNVERGVLLLKHLFWNSIIAIRYKSCIVLCGGCCVVWWLWRLWCVPD